MATMLRITPTRNRKEHRLTYGDLKPVLQQALIDHQEGRLHAAVAGYEEALGQWLRLKWIEASGKYRTEINDPHRFLQKLRSGLHVDQWTRDAIGVVLSRPRKLSWRTADVIRGIVTSVCLDRISTVELEGGVLCLQG